MYIGYHPQCDTGTEVYPFKPLMDDQCMLEVDRNMVYNTFFTLAYYTIDTILNEIYFRKAKMI